jgi:hypothetical protein
MVDKEEDVIKPGSTKEGKKPAAKKTEQPEKIVVVKR